ncbi:hypothetical protein ONA91_25420 [Micromonospora sp. DR5-3]|uniref:hypothetical protein n=1 Tax=unclassified Micromonospora TaxID=2617518 RepID=UPI0011D75AF0|nr:MULTISPECIES: hypothetical protein [unclassified Micromonospora]MCW3817795.1 hypothetical protein [Micromonospora sp. DR5-3]TYC21956.1 hypothetical protein FXF52_23350 [Micromonospora sp. MP36]
MTTTDSRVSTYAWLRPVALTASLLLLGYGILRLVDGLDGHRDKSAWAWMTGHTLFLFGIVAFGAMIVGLHGLLRTASSRLHTVDDVAALAGLVGAAGFVWVILGDLFPRFADAVTTPDLVLLGGPALFELGLLTLLVRAAVARLLPPWGPLLVLVGFGAIAVNLDLLPVGAGLVFAGLLPLKSHR